jgi:hypothetical protein
VTKRQFVFLVLFLLAAAPLVWLNVDAKAGEKLLRWTSDTPQRATANAAMRVSTLADEAPTYSSNG